MKEKFEKTVVASEMAANIPVEEAVAWRKGAGRFGWLIKWSL
jgi:hypothetical protein